MWNTIGGAGRSAGKAAFSRAMGWAGRDASRAALSGAGFYGAAAARGAATGAVIGGVTAIPDKDRGFISGTLAGAFWGGVAGMGGAKLGVMGGAGAYSAARAKGVMQLASGKMSGTQLEQGLRGTRSGIKYLNRGQGGAAVVTGAFGTGAWLMGGSRRRKQYSRYGRSQSGPQQNQGSYGGDSYGGGRRY